MANNEQNHTNTHSQHTIQPAEAEVNPAEHAVKPRPKDHSNHMLHTAQEQPPDHSSHQMPLGDMDHTGHTAQPAQDHLAHSAAHADHTGHENMFRRKFWISLILSIPVILYSMGLQMMLGFSLPAFPGSQWLAPVFGVIVFLYGGLPFLRMAVPELKNRQPGMMTLISLAISVALIYSVATLFLPGQSDFFWELATLIDIMLLGHWIEMRSVRQASGALNALAKLMPDTAERIRPDGSIETVNASQLRIRRPRIYPPGGQHSRGRRSIRG